MRQLTFIFGGSEYKVNEPTFGMAKKWRAVVEKELAAIGQIVEGAEIGQMVQEAAALELPQSTDEINDQTIEKAGAIIQQLAPTFGGIFKKALNSVDLAADLLFAYVGDELDREKIEDIAYPDEIITAFWGCVNSAYPFGTAINIIQKAINTRQRPPTTTRSQSHNGAASNQKRAKKKS